MAHRSSTRTAVNALVGELTAGHMDEDTFIAALIALPVVEQLPAAPEWSDGAVRADGPLRAVRLAAMEQTITPELAARATSALVKAGHLS